MDVNHPEHRDLQRESYLRGQICLGLCRLGRFNSLNRSLSLDRNHHRNETTQNVGTSLKQQERTNFQTRRIEVNFHADHVQHADVQNNGKTHNNLRTKSELHPQEETGLRVSTEIQVGLAHRINSGKLQ